LFQLGDLLLLELFSQCPFCFVKCVRFLSTQQETGALARKTFAHEPLGQIRVGADGVQQHEQLLETFIVALPVLVMVSELLVLDLLDLRLQELIALGLVRLVLLQNLQQLGFLLVAKRLAHLVLALALRLNLLSRFGLRR
jgi:hypothetical protein